MTRYTGEEIGAWTDRLLIGGLRSRQLITATLIDPDEKPSVEGTTYDDEWFDAAYTVTTTAALADELGRIRHVAQGPDGLYAITSNRDGRASGRFPRERDDVLVRLSSD